MKPCPKCSATLATDTWLCGCGYEFSGSEPFVPWTPEEIRGAHRRTALRTVITLLVIGGAIAHVCGFKIFGSAVLYDNRPVLASPRELASLAAPNLIMTSGGASIEVRGVSFTPALLQLTAEQLRRGVGQFKTPVLIEPDSTRSGVVVQYRYNYWCGNTFFLTFFPDRLPRFGKEDFGRYFVRLGLATWDPPLK